jgi:Rieske 2Fe-2S family protein
MSIETNVLRRLRARSPASGLTREFYTDEAIYQLDLDNIFYREWLFAAHTAELKVTGSYLTLQIGAYPILLVRAADGVIRAFINSCRHRGSRLCRDAHGQTPKLVCPYHQWTYELDGRLFAARKMGPDFDRTQFGLRPVHCETVAGYIFVCVADDAPDFGPTRRHIEPYLAPHRLADARVAFESTIIEEGNWKLVWENNRECYHCAVNHPELARIFSDTPTISGVGGADADPTIAGHWRDCEAAGLPSTFRLSADGQFRTARMPLIGNLVSYTSSGRARGAQTLSERDPGKHEHRFTTAVPLSDQLESLPRRSCDQLPAAAARSHAHPADHQVAGPSRCGRRCRLRRPGTDARVAGDQRAGPPDRPGEPDRHERAHV